MKISKAIASHFISNFVDYELTKTKNKKKYFLELFKFLSFILFKFIHVCYTGM